MITVTFGVQRRGRKSGRRGEDELMTALNKWQIDALTLLNSLQLKWKTPTPVLSDSSNWGGGQMPIEAG